VPVVDILELAAHALVCRGPRLVAALALQAGIVCGAHSVLLPKAASWEYPELRSESNSGGFTNTVSCLVYCRLIIGMGSS